MVEEILAARGISVTYEMLRQWGLKFGREFATRIRRRTPFPATNGTSTEMARYRYGCVIVLADDRCAASFWTTAWRCSLSYFSPR